MTLRDALARLDRVQKSRRFKVIATILIGALAIAGYGAWLVSMHAPKDEAAQTQVSPGPGAGGAGAGAEMDRGLDPEEVRRAIGSPEATLAVGVGAFSGAALAILVVWLGLGLTYLGLGLGAIAVGAPLLAFGPTRTWGQIALGCIALTAAFTVLMEGARAALSGSAPVLAIARNVLAEAVRMKISLVFIVMLIFFLAALPGFLDAGQPLRYRVQSFLQYSVGGSFWFLALMTVFFSVGSVAFEQRDRIIWQTMAKPVRHWEYLVGKWLGVATLNAALLTVAGLGSFLFTEHLRRLPAHDEIRAFENADGTTNPTTDRLILQSQVLVARAGAEPDVPPVPREELVRETERTIEAAKERDSTLVANPARLAELTNETYQERYSAWRNQLRTIEVGRSATFVFSGLSRSAAEGRPLTLRYKLQAGTNNPTELYRLRFRVSGVWLPPVQAALNTVLTIPLRSAAIAPDGTLTVEIFNGDPLTGELNRFSMSFPPGDLEVLYVAGGYEINFVRVMAVLWIKLAFLGAVGVAAATFLSFPVACLLALLVLFSAETAGFLMQSLDAFEFRKMDGGEIDWGSVPVRLIAYPIAWTFKGYSELDPAANLVDGRLVSWRTVGSAALMAGAWTIAVLGAGLAIFRNRELATYSGH